MEAASRRAELELLQENRLLTLKEAAWVYGYTYATMRVYSCKGIVETCVPPSGVGVRVTHAAMRKMIAAKKKEGAPRKSERD